MQEQIQAVSNFPPRIYEIANERGVGIPLKAYVRTFLKWQILVVIFWTIIYILGIFFTVQNYLFDRAQANQPPCLSCPASLQKQTNQLNSEALTNDIINLVGESLTGAVFPVGFLLFFYFRRKWPVYLCSEGLLITVKKRTEAIRWDEIDEVYWKKPEEIVLHKAGAERVWNLKYLSGNQEIVTAVEREVSPRLLEQALNQYEKLGKVWFGCLSIGREGLATNSPAVNWSMDERVVSWQKLEDISFYAGALSIKVKGQWKRWDGGPKAQKRLASMIPNPMVYAALARYILEISPAQGT